MEKNEETILENSLIDDSFTEETKPEETGAEAVNDAVVNDAADTAEQIAVDRKESDLTWREVVISGISGIALGATGMLFSGARLKPDEIELNPDVTELNPDETELNPYETGTAGDVTSQKTDDAPVYEENNVPDSGIYMRTSGSFHDIPVATGVNDSMSFNQAFATARREVGSEGAFVWRGQVYTTYYAEEWKALTPAQQNAFSSNAIAAATGHHYGNDALYARSENVEVHILGVEENVVMEDGSLINVGIADVDGHTALFIDADANGTFDLVAVDSNDNGYLDANDDIVPLDNEQINVANFQDAVDPYGHQDDMFTQMPDYSDDPDVTSFV